MKVVTLKSGLKAQMYSEREQQDTWNEVMTNTHPSATGQACYTPRDNKEYFWISEKETSFGNFESILSVKGKTVKVKYNICNQDEKINQAVRKAYDRQ